jgi:hypothetical protein
VLDAWQQHSGSQRQWQLAELPPAMQSLLTELLIDHLPHQYQDDRHWGKKKRVIDGWELERDGLKIETRRRWKEVNHGTWRRYRIRLVDPANTVRLRVHDLAEVAPGTLGFRAEVRSPIRGTARLSRWRWGVQVISVSAEAEARVRMRLAGELSTRLDPVHIPPDIVLIPRVTGLDIDVTDLRLHRISKLDGPLVDELGDGLEQLLEHTWEQQQERSLDRINRRFADQPQGLRFSLHDVLLRPLGIPAAGNVDQPASPPPVLLPPG